MKLKAITLVAGLICLTTYTLNASATIISIQRDYNSYGHLSNEGDSCACTSAVNSMLYLQNKYKDKKGVDNLITDSLNDGIDLQDLDDARDDLRDGWVNNNLDLRDGMGEPASHKDI